MYVSQLTTVDQLRSLKGSWNALSAGIPFRSYPWMVTWWNHYRAIADADGGPSLFVLAVYESPQRRHLLGIAPWFIQRDGWQGRVVRFLGSGEACSEYLSLLSRDGREVEVAEAVADWLTGAGSEQWDAVELTSIAADDATVGALGGQLARLGNSVSSFTGEGCWRIDLPASWDAYLSGLSKSHRRQVRRLERRHLNGDRVRFHGVRDLDDLSTTFDTMVRLHRRRHAALRHRTCFDSPRFTTFLKDAAEQMWEQGQLQINVLQLDDAIVAIDFNLVDDGVVYAYQGGIDPDALDYEPGNLLTIATIRDAIRQGHTAYDLLRGDEPYKAHWRAACQNTIGIRIASNAHMGTARNLAWLASHTSRQWMRRTWQTMWRGQLSALGRWSERRRDNRSISHSVTVTG